MSVTSAAEPIAAAVDAGRVQHAPAEGRRDQWDVSWRAPRLATQGLMLAIAAVVSRGSDPTGNLAIAVFALATFVLLVRRERRTRRLRLELLDELRAAVGATTVAGMAVTSIAAVLGAASVAADMAGPWLLATLLVAGARTATVQMESRARRRGAEARPTLIIGAGKIGRLTARRLAADRSFGLRPVGFLDNEPLETSDDGDLPVLGASWDIDRIVDEYDIRHVVVTFSTAPHDVLLRIARRCEARGIALSVVPRLFESMTERVTIEHVGGVPLVTSTAVDPRGWQFAFKYALDRAVAGLLLLMVLPVFAAAAVATWLSLGRPIFFRQTRIGRDGRAFAMLKFRSMKDGGGAPAAIVLNTDRAPGGVEGEDRRTRVGTFLRKTSLDELPQLLNVLNGDMSLIGPRPERPEFVETFDRSVYRYGDRHRVKAGITGWAQINGLRGKTSISDRAEWDNYYIENWSLWLDLKILARTAGAVVQTEGVE